MSAKIHVLVLLPLSLKTTLESVGFAELGLLSRVIPKDQGMSRFQRCSSRARDRGSFNYSLITESSNFDAEQVTPNACLIGSKVFQGVSSNGE